MPSKRDAMTAAPWRSWAAAIFMARRGGFARARMEQQMRQYPTYAGQIERYGKKWLGKPCYDCAQLRRTLPDAPGSGCPAARQANGGQRAFGRKKMWSIRCRTRRGFFCIQCATDAWRTPAWASGRGDFGKIVKSNYYVNWAVILVILMLKIFRNYKKFQHLILMNIWLIGTQEQLSANCGNVSYRRNPWYCSFKSRLGSLGIFRTAQRKAVVGSIYFTKCADQPVYLSSLYEMLKLGNPQHPAVVRIQQYYVEIMPQLAGYQILQKLQITPPDLLDWSISFW